MISQITRPEPIVDSLLTPLTPMTSKGIRRYQRLFVANGSTTALKLIFKATIKLSAQHSIDQHVKQGLFNSLDIEKKKRTRGKALNLSGDTEKGAQFWSPARIHRAKADLAQKEADIEQERLRKLDAKSLKAARDIEEELQKGIRKFKRDKITTENKAKKAAKSAVY